MGTRTPTHTGNAGLSCRQRCLLSSAGFLPTPEGTDRNLSCTLAGFRPRGRPGDELPDSCKLYVGSLPDSVTDDTLRHEFSKYGEVLHAIVLKDMATQMVRRPLQRCTCSGGNSGSTAPD
jgi:RNA recognition motif. (a.k.a. RRM, RBD, or RNP domain)